MTKDELVAELTAKAEKHEDDAARSERYQASHTYLDPIDDEATSSNTAAAKVYREVAEKVAAVQE